MAFAVWDGENEERNGRKSTSNWISLQLEARVRPPEVPVSEIEEAVTFDAVSVVVTAILGAVALGGIIIFGTLFRRRN